MAASTITYDDKVKVLDPSNDATELVRAVDLNEVKTVVNAHATNIDEVVIDFLAALIPSPSDKEYKLACKMPYDGTINETSAECVSGTCTATFSIDDVDLGGDTNSVSSSIESQAHTTANTFSAGSTIEVTISDNATCVDLNFVIKFTKTVS